MTDERFAAAASELREAIKSVLAHDAEVARLTAERDEARALLAREVEAAYREGFADGADYGSASECWPDADACARLKKVLGQDTN